ncbi:MAG: hypothetical protein R3C19_18790 [Planctomycetaceae bacterium]
MNSVVDKLFAPLRLLFCSSLFSSPRPQLGMSLPQRVGFFSFLFLLLVAVAGLTLRIGLRDVPAAIQQRPLPFAVVAAVLVGIPLLAAWLAKRSSSKADCEFPDIAAAWQEGLRVLQVKGISLADTPLYLVVGPRDAGEARAVVESSDIPFEVSGLPFGDSTLIWFASHEVIFLACPGASQVSLLSRTALGSSAESDVSLAPGSEKSIFDQTVGAVMDYIAASTELGATNVGFGVQPPLESEQGDSGTQQLYDVSNPGFHLMGQTLAAGMPAAPRPKNRLSLDTQSLALASRKLAAVCNLLQQHREPNPAINGVMSFLPFGLITTSDQGASALQSAVAFDNDVICRNIGLRAHLAIMVGGMEQETGFRELVRRFGPEVSRRNRIGKGSSQPWCDPTGESLEALARHACGAFEDNVYPLFAKDHELREPGNPKLYKLLCVSRQRLTNRLARVLRSGYSYERDFERSLPVLGCYFAATGHRPDRRAFASSVFRKLLQHSSSLDWHPRLRHTNERYVAWTNILLGVNLMLIAATILVCVL